MLNFIGGNRKTCDGVSRRNFLKVGRLALGGLTLPGLLRLQSAGAQKAAARKKSVILIWQAGGPSHIDMYDLKPAAPFEVRGEFKPIATNVPGIQISEHLPHQAKIMDKISILRSASHTQGGHGMGQQWMLTGYQPTIEINDNIYPSVGSVAARMNGPNQPGMPPYVNLPNQIPMGKAAYLGAAYNPFSPDSDPNQENFRVRNMKLPQTVAEKRLADRRALLQDLDSVRRDIDTKGELHGFDAFYRDALDMVTNPRAQQAFDMSRETAALRDTYGRHAMGQSCLLARRLVEAGVTFVTIQAGGGWDSHSNNFSELKNNLLPPFDRGVAALVSDLYDRGMQEDVLVMAMGEFGRTTTVNKDAGRDHWPGAFSVLFAGGGLKMGQVVGSTDSVGGYPTSKPASPGCILSTMYSVLGIDPHHVFYDQAQRPMPILNEGEPIKELVGE